MAYFGENWNDAESLRAYFIAVRSIPRLFLWIALLAFGLVIPVFGQTKLSRKQYWDALTTANETASKIFPRKQVYEETTFKDGKTEFVESGFFEYLAAEKLRQVNRDTFNGKPRSIEMIHVGDKFYCRENNGKWKSESQNCGPVTLRALPIPVSQNYSVEDALLDGKKVQLFYSYVTYRGWQPEQARNPPLRFIEDRFWLGADGAMIRRESREGLVDSVGLTYSRVDQIEYSVKIRSIKAPTKL